MDIDYASLIVTAIVNGIGPLVSGFVLVFQNHPWTIAVFATGAVLMMVPKPKRRRRRRV